MIALYKDPEGEGVLKSSGGGTANAGSLSTAVTRDVQTAGGALTEDVDTHRNGKLSVNVEMMGGVSSYENANP